jgi:Domain of unknown function (DUF4902)
MKSAESSPELRHDPVIRSRHLGGTLMRHSGMNAHRYVQIPTSALPAVKLRHLVSERDASIAVLSGAPATVTGITEWVGSWFDESLTVGWDWGVVEGIIVLLNPSEIRTNIQLISPDRRPEPPTLAQIHLFHWIESIPWRELAVNELLQH